MEFEFHQLEMTIYTSSTFLPPRQSMEFKFWNFEFEFHHLEMDI